MSKKVLHHFKSVVFAVGRAHFALALVCCAAIGMTIAENAHF